MRYSGFVNTATLSLGSSPEEEVGWVPIWEDSAGPWSRGVGRAWSRGDCCTGSESGLAALGPQGLAALDPGGLAALGLGPEGMVVLD